MSMHLLTIGRFARLTRLSIKQLRRYDEQGLLAPAWIDPDTGYRFYHPHQARQAATIGILRELEVPLAVIRQLLAADPDRTRALLSAERARRAAEIDRLTRALAGLDRLAAAGTLPDVRARLDDEAPRRLAAVTATAEPERMAAVAARLAGDLARLVPDPAVPFTGLFPVDLADDVVIHIGVESDEPLPGTAPIALAGGRVACATHTGPVDTITLTWWPLLAWVHEQGLTPAGPLRERYVDEHRTELAVPLEKE